MPSVTPSDGPVAVTGASGYVGSHVVLALLRRGYTVHACVTDPGNPDKTEHLKALNAAGHPGRLELFGANLLEDASYDRPFERCSAVLHVGTAMGYGGKNSPRSIYDGAVEGTKNVLDSVRRAGSVRRFVYTSSFSAIGHPLKLTTDPSGPTDFLTAASAPIVGPPTTTARPASRRMRAAHSPPLALRSSTIATTFPV